MQVRWTEILDFGEVVYTFKQTCVCAVLQCVDPQYCLEDTVLLDSSMVRSGTDVYKLKTKQKKTSSRDVRIKIIQGV